MNKKIKSTDSSKSIFNREGAFGGNYGETVFNEKRKNKGIEEDNNDTDEQEEEMAQGEENERETSRYGEQDEESVKQGQHGHEPSGKQTLLINQRK